MNRESTPILRLVCDEMLKGLARWLRAAGHDVVVEADGTADRDVFARARAEDRWLITRDVKMNERRGAGDHVIVLDSNELEHCVPELNRKLGIDWLAAPFTRCLLCNGPTCTAPEDKAERVRAEHKGVTGEIRYCPRCEKAYWEGGHVRRMRERLREWNRLPGPGPEPAPDSANR